MNNNQYCDEYYSNIDSICLNFKDGLLIFTTFDGLKSGELVQNCFIETRAPKSVHQPLHSGLKSVDSLIPIGFGQTRKTTIGFDLWQNQTNLNSNTKLKSIEDFNYDYCDSIDDYNRVYIEINSLVLGLYTKDSNDWSTFYNTLDNDLYLTDAMMGALCDIPPNNAYFKSVEDIEFVTKCGGYLAFIQHKKQ